MNNINSAEEENSGDNVEEYSAIDSFIDYLESEKGHAFANNVLESFTSFRKAKLENHKSYTEKLLSARSYNYKFTLIVNSLILSAAIITASILTYHDKFNATIGVFFGTILGYIFSKQQSAK